MGVTGCLRGHGVARSRKRRAWRWSRRTAGSRGGRAFLVGHSSLLTTLRTATFQVRSSRSGPSGDRSGGHWLSAVSVPAGTAWPACGERCLITISCVAVGYALDSVGISDPQRVIPRPHLLRGRPHHRLAPAVPYAVLTSGHQYHDSRFL